MPLPTPPDSLDSTYTFTPSAEAPQDTPTTLLLWESVDRWHQPIERQLERYLTGDDPHTWASLTGACQALEALHEQSREQVDQLLHAASPPLTLYRPTTVFTCLAHWLKPWYRSAWVR